LAIPITGAALFEPITVTGEAGLVGQKKNTIVRTMPSIAK
jgi:hypothetical protein